MYLDSIPDFHARLRSFAIGATIATHYGDQAQILPSKVEGMGARANRECVKGALHKRWRTLSGPFD